MSSVAIPLALAGVSQACCKRKVGQGGGSGEPLPNRGSVATSGWSVYWYVFHVFLCISLMILALTNDFSRTRGGTRCADV